MQKLLTRSFRHRKLGADPCAGCVVWGTAKTRCATGLSARQKRVFSLGDFFKPDCWKQFHFNLRSYSSLCTFDGVHPSALRPPPALCRYNIPTFAAAIYSVETLRFEHSAGTRSGSRAANVAGIKLFGAFRAFNLVEMSISRTLRLVIFRRPYNPYSLYFAERRRRQCIL